jgi:hypothetical protein
MYSKHWYRKIANKYFIIVSQHKRNISLIVLHDKYISNSIVCVTDDVSEGLSDPSPWEDSRLDERIFADTPNYLTYQLNHKRYAVPYHPVARLRASQTAGVVLPYAMIANRNYVNDDGNRCNILS